MAIADLSEYLVAARTLIELFKGIKSELPQGPKAEQTQEQIDRAEQALQAAAAQLAKELGYNLCQCTFPPQIMLSQGTHPSYEVEVFKCPQCNKQKPPEIYFRKLDEEQALADHDPDWISGRI